MRRGIRFRPPEVELDEELRWLLEAAFGTGKTAGTSAGLAPERAVELATRLDVAARIASRTPRSELAEMIGEWAAGELDRSQRMAAGTVLQCEAASAAVAEVAAQLGQELVVLKGLALHLAGRVVLGSRFIGDVDVLSPDPEELQTALRERGLTESRLGSAEHQLPVLTDSSGTVIEVHRMVRGLRLESAARSAGCRDLLGAGLCEPAPSLPTGCFIPVEDVLLAHVLVHGVGQHGLEPRSYPPLRMLADLHDLGFGRQRSGDLLAGRFRWIADDVSREEAAALAALVDRLGTGDDPQDVISAGDGPAIMLRHLLAGVLDEDYRGSLKLARMTDLLPGDGRFRTAARTWWRTLWLSDAQVEALYGPPRSRWAAIGWRLWRPFDLLMRVVRAVRAGRSVRGRDKGGRRRDAS
jgi:hypothetical protein